MEFFDKINPSNVRRTADGYLVADAPVARTGIQIYLGSEVGRPELAQVRVLRPESEVFSNDSLRSYAHRPITDNHPSEQVDSKNWKKYARGQTGGDVVRDGELVRVPLVLMDQESIEAYEKGKRELSMGYSAEIEFVSGVTDSGEAYDAVQRNLRMNHLALVDRARGGDQLRIGDNNGGLAMANKIILVDGISVEVTEQGAQVIEKLQRQLSDSAAAVSSMKSAHEKELAVKDSEIGKKDAEIENLKTQILSDADLDRMISERGELIAKARAIVDADYSGKSPAQIRRAAVAAILGDEALTAKTDAYVEARFDALAESALKDAAPVGGDPLRMNVKPKDSQTDNGQSAYEKRLADAWKH